MNVCTWGSAAVSRRTLVIHEGCLEKPNAVVVADSYLLLGCLFPTFLKDCTVPRGCFFVLRLSLGLKMVEVC